MKITNIDWDTDDEPIEGLPTEVTISEDIEPDAIADYLSDQYGFCIKGFCVEDENPLPDNAVLMEPGKDYVLPINGGYLTLSRACDPDYPGVYVGFCLKPGGLIQDLVLVEDNNVEYPGKLRVHVWEDDANESSTYDETVERANLKEEEEKAQSN